MQLKGTHCEFYNTQWIQTVQVYNRSSFSRSRLLSLPISAAAVKQGEPLSYLFPEDGDQKRRCNLLLRITNMLPCTPATPLLTGDYHGITTSQCLMFYLTLRYLRHLKGTNTEKGIYTCFEHHTIRSVTLGAWNHTRERGKCLQRAQKRNLCKYGAWMCLAYSAVQDVKMLISNRCRMVTAWQVTSFCSHAFGNGQWHALP